MIGASGKRNVIIALITASLLILLFGGIYLWAIRGEAYRHSLKYIRDSSQIAELLGDIENQHLSFWGKYYVRSDDSSGKADFKIIVHGTKNDGVVLLELQQVASQWKVISGKLVYAGENTVIVTPES